MAENIKVENRVHTVAVRLTPLQFNRLKKAADRKGLPPSVFAYLAVLDLTTAVLQTSNPFDDSQLSIL